jgi:hypothetical protein
VAGLPISTSILGAEIARISRGDFGTWIVALFLNFKKAGHETAALEF